MAGQGPRRYAVLHRYSSGEHGPWELGTTVELTPAQADWVNRDSPGTLAPVKPGAKLVTGQPVPPSKLLDAEPEPAPAAAEEAPAAAEPEPPAKEKQAEGSGDPPAASTKDEGAPVATQPRGRRSRGRSGRG